MTSLGKHFETNPEDLLSESTYTFKGVNYRITVLSERLVRFEYSVDGNFYDGKTELVNNRKFEPFEMKAEHHDNYLVITTRYFVLQYAKEKPFKGPAFAPESNLKVKLINSDKTWYYGHSESHNFKGTASSIEDFGKETTLKNGLYSSDGFAVLDDSNSMLIDEFGFMTPNTNKRMDFYLFLYHRDFGLCLKDYFTLTGNAPMLPRYALGVWWNKDIIYNFNDIKMLVNLFKKNEIPLSVLLLGEFWHKKDASDYNLFKTGYSFNEDLFPNPKEFIEYLHNKKICLGVNLDGREGINEFENNYVKMKEDLRLERNGLIPFKVFDQEFIVSYFKNLINPLYEIGVDFFWLDTKDEMTLRCLNYYHYNDFKKLENKRPLLLSRNNGIASHKYPVHYSGETKVSWDTLKYLPWYNLTSSNIGVSWWSHDVGGFKDGIEDSELYSRYVEFSCFSPIFRFSSKRGLYYKREPWSWDIKTYSIAKNYTKLRHRLIPYLYSENYKYYKYSLPLIQPLYYYHPEIVSKDEYRNEYYFGNELLVAPITSPKDELLNRSVEKIFLPKGTWYDFQEGKKYYGNKNYVLFYKEEEYPVFAKAGAIIPLAKLNDNLNDTSSPTKMEIQIFPGSSNAYRLYEDDGVSMKYKDGYYIITAIDYNYSKDNYDLSIHPVEGKTGIINDYRDYEIRFRNSKQPEKITVSVNNQIITDYDVHVDENDLVININHVDTKKHLNISCSGNVEIENVKNINEEFNEIISDLKIETIIKEKLASIFFSSEDALDKKSKIKKLKSLKLNELLTKKLIELLDYMVY